MSLNIKNERTHKLVAQLATMTGESMTEAVTVAVEERLERERRKQKADGTFEALLEIGRRCAQERTTYQASQKVRQGAV